MVNHSLRLLSTAAACKTRSRVLWIGGSPSRAWRFSRAPVEVWSTNPGRCYSSSAPADGRKTLWRDIVPYIFWFSVGAGLNTVYHSQRDGTSNQPKPLNEDLLQLPKTTGDTITNQLNSEAQIQADRTATSHSTRVASNSPCEDRLIQGQLSASKGLLQLPWHAWGVFDGHAGSFTAALLTERLLPTVEDAFGPLPIDSSDAAIENTIKTAFVALDDSIVKGAIDTIKSDVSYHEKIAKLMPAYTGSCALLALFDPRTWTLRVACTGDSRAVLGRQDGDGQWDAKVLSVDQTGSNEEEIARLNAEHPGETEITKAGRVLGLMVSRGFGDGRWKWSLEDQKEIKEKFDGFDPLNPEKYAVKTPPYLSAEPVVTTTKLDDARPSFLIMASDGLWDRISNEQAVKLVGQWLETRSTNGKRRVETATDTILPDLQVQHGPFEVAKHRQGEEGFHFTEDRTVNQDDNAAVHLVRNALGGNFQEMIAANLAVGPPFSRWARDDITVQVIFFDPKSNGALR